MNEILPMVKFHVTIEHMRKELFAAIMLQNEELTQHIKCEVDEALKDFRFDSAFYNAINKNIQEECSRIAYEAVKEAFSNKELRDAVEKETLKALKTRFKK